MQVADDSPGARQAFAGIEHGLHAGVPGRRGFRRDQGFYQGTILIEQLADGGGDVFGLNGVEAGQAAEIEEWVHGVHDGYER